MNRFLLFAVLLFVMAVSVNADVLPDGKKRVQYSFELTNIDSYPDYTFIAFPFNSSNGVPDISAVIITKDLPLSPSCKYSSPLIYAVKTADFNRLLFDSLNNIEERNIRSVKLKDFFTGDKFIKSGFVNCEAFAERDAKYYYINEQYSVESITNDSVIIKSKKVIYKDNSKNIIDAKDSKSKLKDDVVSPADTAVSYLIFVIPVLGLILLVTILVIRKKRK